MRNLFVLAAFVALASAQLDLAVTNGAVVFRANVSIGATNTGFANAQPFSAGTELLRGFTAIPGAGNSSQPYLAYSSAGNFYRISGDGQSASLLFSVNCTGQTNASALSLDINPVTGIIALFTISPATDANGKIVASNFFYVDPTTHVCTPQTLVNYTSDTTAVKALGISYYYNTNNNSTTLYLLAANATSNAINLFVVPPAGGSLGTQVGTTGLNTTSGTGGLTVNYGATNQAVLVVYNATGNSDSTVATVDLTTGAATTAGYLPTTFVPFGFAIIGNPFPVSPKTSIASSSSTTSTTSSASSTTSTATSATATTSTSTSPSATSTVTSTDTSNSGSATGNGGATTGNGGATTGSSGNTATVTGPTKTITITTPTGTITATTTADARTIGVSFAVLALGAMMVLA